ncbi:class A beta-lactamase [Streptomyces sp. NPDC091281]|uniref:class A beta-lactamase n=1 Tax=Streptomyces sp. NPDC091281 TaxID=3365985 RepID=UPI00380E4F30
MRVPTNRRTLLAATAATAASTAAALLTGGTAHAAPDRARTTGHAGTTGTTGHDDNAVSARLRALEERHGARLGVFAYDVRGRRAIRHRAGERFPVCSLFKVLAAGAVLRDLDRHGEVLARRVHWTAADVVSNSPVTGTEEHIENGLTVAELCEAAICDSDNTAGNLLLRALGGPDAVTRFARSLGDRTTRLDRWEPDLNSAEPGRETDTTSPYAIARSYARLVLGDALPPADRDRLTSWMRATRTSGNRFRAGVPAGWTVADKTGGGFYGADNDAGVLWTPDGRPVVLAVLLTKPDRDAAYDHELIVRVVESVVEAVG